MAKKALVILTLLIFTIIPMTSAANDFAYNRLYTDTQVIDGFNYSINVNSSENWITDIGSLSTVNATTFSNQGGVLNVIKSWWDGLYCQLTGCTIDGDFNVTGNLNVTNNLTVSGCTFWHNGTIFIDDC